MRGGFHIKQGGEGEPDEEGDIWGEGRLLPTETGDRRGEAISSWRKEVAFGHRLNRGVEIQDAGQSMKEKV